MNLFFDNLRIWVFRTPVSRLFFKHKIINELKIFTHYKMAEETNEICAHVLYVHRNEHVAH